MQDEFDIIDCEYSPPKPTDVQVRLDNLEQQIAEIWHYIVSRSNNELN